MKLGVSSYSFSKHYGNDFDLFNAIQFAKQTGYECIDFTDLQVPENETAENYAERIKKAAGTAGLEVCAYTVWADFINSFDGNIEKEVQRLKGCIDIAEILGARMLRHDVTWGFTDTGRGRSYKDAIKIALPGILEVTGYAQGKGIRTMSENHGYFMQDSYRMEELVISVNHSNYGLLIDIGNFICADEDPICAVSRVAPYAFHVHAKDFIIKRGYSERPDEEWFPTRGGDFIRGTIAGHGIVPVRQCLSILKSSGYEGAVALEFEGTEDTLRAIKLGYDALKKASNT